MVPIVPVVLDQEADEDRDAEDGTPVGKDDQRADVERSGGDPDDV
ncbi:hypothetical protein [Dactylosporangium sp. CS-033363]